MEHKISLYGDDIIFTSNKHYILAQLILINQFSYVSRYTKIKLKFSILVCDIGEKESVLSTKFPFKSAYQLTYLRIQIGPKLYLIEAINYIALTE